MCWEILNQIPHYLFKKNIQNISCLPDLIEEEEKFYA